jgi:hypothetical protein
LGVGASGGSRNVPTKVVKENYGITDLVAGYIQSFIIRNGVKPFGFGRNDVNNFLLMLVL